MRIYSMKSIVLGMGLGMILSSICGIIYFNSLNISKGYDKETINSENKIQGIVKPEEVPEKKNIIMQSDKTPTIKDINVNNGTATSPTPVTVAITPVSATPTPLPIPEIPKPTLGSEVTVKVEFGDTAIVVAKKLFDSGLIQNQAIFVDQMISTRVAYNMMVKTHIFRMGMEPSEILIILITS